MKPDRVEKAEEKEPTELRSLPGKPHLKQKAVTVTPEIAREWLKLVRKNRSLKRNHLLRLARDMKEDRWDLNGQGITFDRDGELADGQHRLHACTIANVSFRTTVVWGVEPTTRKTMDTGVGRRASDVLTLEGERCSNLLGAILAHIWRYKRGTLGKSQDIMTRYELLDMLKKAPETRMSAALAATLPWKKIGRPSALGFCHWAFKRKDDLLADLFFEGLVTGEMIRVTEPVFKLRDRLLSNMQNTKTMTEKEFFGLVIKAWNLTRAKKSIRVLTFKMKQEKIPKII